MKFELNNDTNSKVLKFESNNDINSKVSFCQGDFTKINADAIVSAVNKTLISGGTIYGAIHEAAAPGLLFECQKLNRCETCDCKVTLDNKLRANYVFHTVRPRDKHGIKLKDRCKSCLQNVLTYNVKSIAFCCAGTGIPGFDQKKGAEIALVSARIWLESNHSSVNRVIFCTYENADYEIYKDLMSIVCSLREKCPNMDLFLVRIFLYSVRIQEITDQK